ncbi:MAG: DNA primase [Clostridia bacterium]|nr:DNA primase [Clostridia bacterium]
MAGELKEFLTTLKEKLNIIEVAGNYVSLERRGGNWWACCPFHHEKTPSFAINETDQFYHCFGCGESGDVIKFVQNMENIEFMDAVKLLAERANLQVPQTGFDSQQTVELKRKKDAILKILNDCAHFYLNNLNSGKADAHVEYILKRQIPSNIVRKFGLGASLNFYDLPKYLLSKGYDRQDMIDSGAINEADGKLLDAQGGRLIYPIINAMDEVIAFGGRVLKKTDFGKYKNTKETLVFNKSKTLYNINLLKKLKKEQTINEVIIVEGYMDTLSLYQAGFKNVVASMGTSLTQDQARLLKRYTENVLISYDGDSAGQKANMRGLDVLKSNGLNVKVVPLTDGLDPDDMIKQKGAAAYQRCLDNSLPLIDYKLASVGRGFDLSKTDDKRKFVQEAIKIIKTADSAAEQEDLLKSLSEKTGISYESLNRDLRSEPKVEAPVPKPVERKDNSSMQDRASRFVIAAFLFGSKIAKGEDISQIRFLNGVHDIIAKYIFSKQFLEERIQPSELFEFFDEGTEEYTELTKILDYCDGNALQGEVAAKYFKDCVKTLKIAEVNAEIVSVQSRIANETDGETRKVLTEKLQTLINKQKKIKRGEQE